jgi:sulfite reductase (NADPH) flavoprotein alpha-component
MSNTVPHIPESAPFPKEQRAWLNGMFAGMYSEAEVDPTALDGAEQPASNAFSVTVVYGSQSGNAERLSRNATKALDEQGFRPERHDLADFDLEQLEEAQVLLMLCSTHGEGDMPDNADLFWQELAGDAAPDLDHLHYSVLALGDSSYLDFCQAGKDFDHRLDELGAERFVDRVDCDVDYEEPFEDWLDEVVAGLHDLTQADDGDGEADPSGPSGDGAAAVSSGDGTAGTAAAVEASVSSAASSSAASATHDKNNPYDAPLLENRLLNTSGSNKEVRHYALSLEDSGLSYEAGDALGVVPRNCPSLVDAVLDGLGCEGDEEVTGTDGEPVTLYDALLSQYALRELPAPMLKVVAERTSGTGLSDLLDDKAATREYLAERDLVDLLHEYPVDDWAPQDFVEQLRTLQSRLYSIASSPAAHTGQVHLTVGTVRYSARDRRRKGVCSTFLADRVESNDTLPVYLQPNKRFGLPDDPDRPIIMVGPGTGIAPFRAFLHERRAGGAAGPNWLFFGDQYEDTDFLYREEMASLRDDGTLDRMSTAFSRDQDEKVYVQHRMMEHADALYGWLEEGAHFYVCGDMTRMAKDVDDALHRIIQQVGGASDDGAQDYVMQLKKEGRYQRDVY